MEIGRTSNKQMVYASPYFYACYFILLIVSCGTGDVDRRAFYLYIYSGRLGEGLLHGPRSPRRVAGTLLRIHHTVLSNFIVRRWERSVGQSPNSGHWNQQNVGIVGASQTVMLDMSCFNPWDPLAMSKCRTIRLTLWWMGMEASTSNSWQSLELVFWKQGQAV